MSYFSILNRDLLLILLSKIRHDELDVIAKSCRLIKILLIKDEVYEYLLMYFNPDLYKFIKCVENIDGFDSWYNIYHFFKNPHTTSLGTNNSYHSDLLYLYKIKCIYPQIYLYAKNINLNHEGFGTKKGFFNWCKMYNLLWRYGGYDFFGECSSKSKYEVLRKDMCDSLNLEKTSVYKDQLFFLQILDYVNRSCDKSLSKTDIITLYKIFSMSHDIYQLTIDSMSSDNLLSIINDKSKLDSKRPIGSVDSTRAFYEDLDDRLKLKMICKK